MYPKLQKLPLTVQQMIHEQFQAALKRFEEGRSYQISTETYVCSCDFYHKYLLPCKHMFYEDLGMKVILSLMMNAGMILQTIGKSVVLTSTMGEKHILPHQQQQTMIFQIDDLMRCKNEFE
jgi:hypothetical protein